MQFKGLVRFFAILLIIYSLYQLSFTWFVKNHEKKMEAKAFTFVKANHADAKKFTRADDLPDSLKTVYDEELKRLLASTKDETLTYGITGPVSYQKAKEEELNLGLDLQGGMNVTLEVEMTGLLRTLASNSKDPAFLAALSNAEKQKANSDADFVTLFTTEYKKLAGEGKMAALFFAANPKDIRIGDSDDKVVSVLRKNAKDAFDNTFRVLNNRIDQFGVAQPSINPNPDRGTITVELPGIKDKERVRKLLQSTANLQFWETYRLDDLQPAIVKSITDYNNFIKGIKTDSTVATATDSVPPVAKTPVDSAKDKLSEQVGIDSPATAETAKTDEGKPGLDRLIQFSPAQGGIGLVNADKDSAEVRKILTSPLISKNFPSDARFAFGIPSKADKKMVPLYVLRTYNREKAPMEGEAISDAYQDYDNANPIVSLEMNSQGAIDWGNLTDKTKKTPTFAGIPIAIVLDGIVYSAPVAEQKLGDRSRITGDFTVLEAQDLANILKSGKLSAPAKILQDQEVGPTLGKEAINGGAMAFFISFIVIFLLMLVYYNTSGWIANIALILNLLFTVGVLTGLGATLTAPGIAGLVLTIGMAVDTNVIIYERIKEELTKGKGYIPAINEGYKRSLPPVLDGHITILLTAIILYYFGLGPVKGFATTQILGILLSLFCGILVSRWISDIFTNKKRHLQYFTGISRKVFQHAKFKFIEYRKIAYGISFVILGLGIASFFNGFDYGVEFNGGRSYTVRFDNKVDVEQVRKELTVAFNNESPVIKTIGDTKTLDITTAYLIDETNQTSGQNVDSVVMTTLMTGLKNHLPAGMTYDQFANSTKYKIASKKVLPTISDDLKKGAVQATLFALLAIFLYIFIRFRDWRYSLGTIVALLHDVLVTLIVFSFARAIVPFPLEIDQHFIAAVLTVIGFSMNDTVIVFDRIREDRKLYPSAALGDTINRAINETLSRTIMTSLTVFLTILILFIFGGEVTRGFAFAMLIGVITGTYSSIFVAAPILVDLGTPKGKKAAVAAKPAETKA
ncbi:MAG: protein translocase subunit SecDF [Chitinophagales bacterium]|nr:protein translocase subunit SecDF [Chitinophagales bacterium]